MSQHIAEVVPVELTPHPDADTLSIVYIGGFSVCVRTADWVGKTKGIFVLPDSLCDVTRPEFTFLDRGRPLERVKARKLRGVWSVGLLIPCDESEELGSDHFERLSLSWYDPEVEDSGIKLKVGHTDKVPVGYEYLSKYDLENGRSTKYKNLFIEGETVYVTQKLEGANSSVFFDGERFHVKSRNFWKKEEEGCSFWQALYNAPEVMEWCKKNPKHIVVGEAVGAVKSFRYDTNGKMSFRPFDIMTPDFKFISAKDFHSTCQSNGIISAPVVGFLPFCYEELLTIAENSCMITGGVSEGIVVRPEFERLDARLGRTIVKIKSNKYLEMK